MKCNGGPKQKAHAYTLISDAPEKVLFPVDKDGKPARPRPQCLSCLNDTNEAKRKPTLPKKHSDALAKARAKLRK